MKKKHSNIPIFIPELACPNQCVFCNQKNISGTLKAPTVKEIHSIIQTYLSSLNPNFKHIELAFFGGNFTGLSINLQELYLSCVQDYLKSNQIQSIRISTRPDYINQNILNLLLKYNVKTIELGAQSFDDSVLSKSGRGHTSKDIINASKLIKSYGFNLGLQMMIGLPGDSSEKSINSANQIIKLNADFTRIYPTLVIKNTQLEKLYLNNQYKPLSLKHAILQSKKLLTLFEAAKIPVIRLGLHPSEGLLSHNDYIDGPFHPSFRELVLTEIWFDLFNDFFQEINHKKSVQIFVSPKEYNYAIGYESENKNRLLKKFKKAYFLKEEALTGRDFRSQFLD